MAYTTKESLLERIKNQDEEAWVEFYDRHYRLIYSIGKRFNLNSELCNDLIQQVMIARFNNSKTFRYQPELGKFRSYLFGITKNIIWRIKKEYVKAQECLPAEPPSDEQSELEKIIHEEWHRHLLDTLLHELRCRVEETTFDAFQMYILQGKTPEEVADCLDISISTVYVHKSRCLKHLKEIVAEIRKSEPDFNF